MAVLSWGKPTVEIAEISTTDPGSTFTTFPIIKENTAILSVTAGNKTEAKGEGGELVDARYEKSTYQFKCEIFVKKGDTRPIEDVDGIIAKNYTLRLTPEDDETEGFIMDKCNVSCAESWSSADGKLIEYTFDGLLPTTGKILKPYTKP